MNKIRVDWQVTMTLPDWGRNPLCIEVACFWFCACSYLIDNRPIQNVYRDYVFCARRVPVEKLKRTREFTLCFRHMTHSQIHFHQLIKTEQFQLSLGNDKDQGFYGFLDLDQLNAVTEDSRISRLFTLCTSFPPGQWVSMCFAVKLSKHAQQLTVFQDGHHCFNKTFADSDLEWIYLKRSMAVREV